MVRFSFSAREPETGALAATDNCQRGANWPESVITRMNVVETFSSCRKSYKALALRGWDFTLIPFVRVCVSVCAMCD